MATLVVYADVADRTLGSSNSSFATAVTGSGLHADGASQAWHELGASFYTPTYYINEVFLPFDTSALPDTATIDSATLAIYGRTDDSSTDFDIEAGLYDWGASIGTEDWLDGSDTGGITVRAVRNTSGWTNAGYNSFSTGTMAAVISKTGVTKIALWPQRVRTGMSPANGQWVTFWAADEAESGERRPRLTIEYTEASSDTEVNAGLATVSVSNAATRPGVAAAPPVVSIAMMDMDPDTGAGSVSAEMVPVTVWASQGQSAVLEVDAGLAEVVAEAFGASTLISNEQGPPVSVEAGLAEIRVRAFNRAFADPGAELVLRIPITGAIDFGEGRAAIRFDGFIRFQQDEP